MKKKKKQQHNMIASKWSGYVLGNNLSLIWTIQKGYECETTYNAGDSNGYVFNDICTIT